MKKTKYILFTKKENPNYAKKISHKLMIRAGIISKISSGIYTWLPNGVRVLKNIKKIIHNEMKKNSCIEIILPILQPSSLWNKSKRIKSYGNELFKILDRKNKTLILSPTHEEIITNFIKNKIHSYKELPIILYQIQTKFRDEIRPKSGILRTREFIMKDAYSFHENKKSLQKTYKKMYIAYIKIFKKMNLKTKIIKVNNGVIGGSISHEFHVNYKKKKNKLNSSCTKSKIKSIEIGHIFQLNKTYSKIFNVCIQTKKKEKKKLEMGCYGIGISRLIGAIIENNHDKKGIIWPISIAPFQVCIIPINILKNKKIKKISNKIYSELKKENITVLFYNKPEQPGIMFSETDLIGCPYKIIISNSTIINNCVELQNRKTKKKENIKINKISKILLKKIKLK
ncbi:MAG: proline--tRNA ligase [Buchnera aphidicola (Periphyllus lyropictus)]|uniref:proline--tRNA ligase n=1 Tax=Buchnera aphidicola TaxID=9 RepID=UPI001ECC75A7|nr:proline--tRNA ligase [Buchnera aphidicola]NIH16632.1 proline--tRNA ligase [Buchnera aphidicola (Periphyllus lyropictus)]USS94543.1 proline--tRNA ligase [Buchnera aphidicola (Periphyllus lyropictus)]